MHCEQHLRQGTQLRTLSLIGAIILFGCGTTLHNKSRVDFVISTRRPKHSIGILQEDIAPAIGQWALYRTLSKDDEPGYLYVEMAGPNKCGVWLKFVQVDYRHRVETSFCFHSLPLDLREDAVRKLRLLEVIIDGDRSMYDITRFPDIKTRLQNALSPSHQSVDTGDVTVTIAAGTFAGCHRNVEIGDVVAWRHGGVPFGGLLQAETSGRRTVELLDFGRK